MMMFDEKGKPMKDKPAKSSAKSDSKKEQQNLFVEKLIKHLNELEVELPDGTMVSNIDGIIDNLIGKALDGDIVICKLIRDLLNNK